MTRLMVALMLMVAHGPTPAGDNLEVDNAWIREAPPGATTLAAYLVIRNRGDSDVRLTEVTSPAFAHVMMHQSVTRDGVARMLHRDSIPIPAHGTVRFEPGGLHLMMPAPATRLTLGDKVDLWLHFADGRRIRAAATVRKKP